MDLAALDIKITTDLASAYAELDKAPAKIQKAAASANTLVTSFSKVTGAANTTSAATTKLTSLLDGTSGGFSEIASNINTLQQQASYVPKSFEDISDSVDAFAADFNNKWSPIVEQAGELAAPLAGATQSVADLQKQVSAFGGGVFKFNVEGLQDVVQQSNLVVTAIDSIPAQKTVDFRISENTQSALQDFSALSDEIADLGNGGSVSIAKLITALAQLKGASITVTNANDVKQYANAIELLSKDLSNVQNATRSAGSGLTNLSKTTSGAAYATRFAVQDISNVFRDLPFAINNPAIATSALDHVVGALGSLKQATGSTKGALAALGESLTGFGGLIIAFNLIGAAVSLFGDKLSSGSDAAEEAAKANEEYAKSLKSIDENAVKDAEKAITQIQILTTAAQSNTLALNERLKSAGKLQEDSGYFAALTKEQILYGDITDAINKTTQALFNKAYADAASSKAAEAGAKAYNISLKYKQALQEQTAAQQEFNAAQKATNINASGGGTGGVIGLNNSDITAAKADNVYGCHFFPFTVNNK